MDIKNIKREDGKVSFQVTVDPARFEQAVNQAYLHAKKSIAVPGFRKGKAPRMVIEGMYGAGVFYEDAVESIAYECYQAGLEQVKDRVVGDPAITNYNVADDKSLTIDFESTLYPEVKLGEYKGLSAYKAPVKVTADDVKQELESIQKRNGRIVDVERAAQNGDTVKIDFDGYRDGKRFDGGKAEGYELTLGSGSFVPGFEEKIVGMKAGDEKDIDITFPEDYTKELAGAAVVFKVKVHEVKETQLPALDDEFAKDVSEFDTLKDYKASIKKDLEAKRRESAENEFRGRLMQKALANLTVEIPAAMIDQRVNSIVEDYARNCARQGYTLEQYFQMMGISEQAFRTYIRPSAENDIRTEMLLEQIVDAENFEVTADEIAKEYETAAKNYNMELDKLKESVPEDIIVHDIKMRKASEIICTTGVALDEPEDKPEETESEEKPAKKPAAKKTAKKAEGETEGEEKPAKKPAAKKTAKKAEDKPEEKTEE